jgi:hypothetical protein
VRQQPITLLLSGLLLAVALAGNPQAAQVAMDWQGLDAAWSAYRENPVGDNAIKILNLLPDNVKITDIRDGFLVINKIFDQLGILESETYSGEANAVKLSLRFYTISYGPFEAALNRINGNLIRFKTRLFLEEVSNQRALFPNLLPIVGSFINDFPDDPAGRELERKMRTKALEAVEDKDLKSLRNECLKILKKL